MIMLGPRNNWLAQEITNISQTLTRMSAEMSALTQNMKNLHSEQAKIDVRVEKLEARVTVVEQHDVSRGSKWEGAKYLWLGFASFMATVVAVLTVLAFFI